jgi:putative methionine-R-sulfoxide reductase with GAF domain
VGSSVPTAVGLVPRPREGSAPGTDRICFCFLGSPVLDMAADSSWLEELPQIISGATPRMQKLQRIAALIRESGDHRWVGLYEIDERAGEVINLVWNGPDAPEYPRFPIGKGLTSAAIQERRVINVGDVVSDPRYLTAFGSTRSEIIVPILDVGRAKVVGTIDVESELANAFDQETEKVLVTCAEAIASLWR